MVLQSHGWPPHQCSLNRLIALLFVVLVLEGLNKYKDGVIDTYEQFTSKQEEVIKEYNSLITDLKVKVTYYAGELKKVKIIEDLDHELEAKDIELQEINRQIEEKKAELETMQ